MLTHPYAAAGRLPKCRFATLSCISANDLLTPPDNALHFAVLRAPLNTRARTSPLHSFGLSRNAFTSFGIASGRVASLRYAAAIWPLLTFALFPGLLPPSADAAAILLVLRYVSHSRLNRWQFLTSAALLLCPLFATLATSCTLVPPRSYSRSGRAVAPTGAFSFLGSASAGSPFTRSGRCAGSPLRRSRRFANRAGESLSAHSLPLCATRSTSATRSATRGHPGRPRLHWAVCALCLVGRSQPAAAALRPLRAGLSLSGNADVCDNRYNYGHNCDYRH